MLLQEISAWHYAFKIIVNYLLTVRANKEKTALHNVLQYII